MIRILLLSITMMLTVGASAQRIVTLEECIASARANNITMRNARSDLQMAREQQKYARTKYLPTVSASAAHYEATDYMMRVSLFSSEFAQVLNDLSKEIDIGFDPNNIQAFKNGSAAGITLLQPIYLGGRLTAINKLTDLQVEARLKQQDMADDLVVQETELLYFLLMKMHGKDRTLTAVDKEVASIKKDAQNLADEGIVNQNDVLSVELLQDRIASLHVRLDNAMLLTRRSLANQIGLPDEDIDIDTTLTVDIVQPSLLWVDSQTAIDSRSESQLLDLNVRRTQLETKLAKAFKLPILLLGGNFGMSRVWSETNTRGIAFATLSMPISTFWSEQHEINRRKIAEQKALDYRQDKREMMDLQVRNAYDNLESAYRQVQIAQKSIRRADENLRAKREQYINGVINMSILLDAQRQQQEAHDQYSDALCDYQQSRTTYLILTGRRKM